MDAIHAHMALDVWGAKVIHDLANIECRPFEVGLTQLFDGGGAGRIVRQVQASVNYFVLTDDDLWLQTQVDLHLEETNYTYVSRTGTDHLLEMKRFVWLDLVAAFTRLISAAPASDVLTYMVEMTVCTELSSKTCTRVLTSV
jgi:hypothetical protein